MLFEYYLEKLDFKNMPKFLIKYLKSPSLVRLKKVGYFCGMDYASKDIYNFSEYISRYDHSLSVSLLVYKLTGDKSAALAALFHDVGTPCFSHVVDYMNEDYEKQESTEAYTEYVVKNDEYLLECLKEDNIDWKDIVNFKKYSIVDNERPKLCADRLDGVILTGIGWTKDINKKDIDNIVEDMYLFKNEFEELEIGFKSIDVTKRVLEVSENINTYCHSKEDNYMMQLLATITKFAIDKNFISYEGLYLYNEDELFDFFESIDDINFKKLICEFKNIKCENIPEVNLPKVKVRTLNPIVNGNRINIIKKTIF